MPRRAAASASMRAHCGAVYTPMHHEMKGVTQGGGWEGISQPPLPSPALSSSPSLQLPSPSSSSLSSRLPPLSLPPPLPSTPLPLILSSSPHSSLLVLLFLLPTGLCDAISLLFALSGPNCCISHLGKCQCANLCLRLVCMSLFQCFW